MNARACSAAVVCLVACSRPSPPDKQQEVNALATAVAPAVATTSASASASTFGMATTLDSGCEPATRIDPTTLSAQWPSMLGKRVSFSSHVERALDVTQSIVVARGERFVVFLAPDQSWLGEATRTFVVMGSVKVKIGGSTTLPQLLLDNECTR